ncbi:GlsB/YeaQ/YmgE family stress response membrane protein, partial [Sphingorhabdus sp.]
WNVVAGCVGSVVGNLIANQFGIVGSVKEFSVTGLVVAFVGAVIVLGIMNLVQRGRVR